MELSKIEETVFVFDGGIYMFLTPFHGFCMALADSVPGVSGGTVAFILGFYDRFINALYDLFGRDNTARKTALVYLLKLGVGWMVGMALCVSLLASLFSAHIYFMSSLFLGLTVVSVPFVALAEKKALCRWQMAPFALLGMALVVGLTMLRGSSGLLTVDMAQLRAVDAVYLFLSGAVAITAMVLPGISGSSILLIAGVYLPVIQAIRQFLHEDLTKNGWTISSTGYNSDSKIAGNSYDTFDMAKDGRRISITSYNMSGNVKPIKECKVGGIECATRDGVNFTIAKGITPSSSAEKIKNAFGVPGYSKIEDTYETMTYYVQKDSTYNCVKFYISNDSEYSNIRLRNFIETEDDKTSTNTERPEYLNSYKAPTTMGNDLKSAVVKIEGDLYQLPAPVSAFLNNGWTISQQSGDVVAGGRDYIQVEKDGKKLELNIANYSEYQTTVENCVVYKVSLNDYGKANADVSIGSTAQPITLGTAKADVEAAVSDDFDCTEGNYSYSYSYYEYEDYKDMERDFNVTIRVDKETHKVSSFDVSCKTWEY